MNGPDKLEHNALSETTEYFFQDQAPNELPHIEDRAITGITRTPEGREVIGMTLNNINWALWGVKDIEQVYEYFGVIRSKQYAPEAFLGVAYDVNSTLRQGVLVLDGAEDDTTDVIQSNSQEVKLGIYVYAENYDRLKNRDLSATLPK